MYRWNPFYTPEERQPKDLPKNEHGLTINGSKPALVLRIRQYIHVEETKRKEEVCSGSNRLALLVIQKWMAFLNIATRYSFFFTDAYVPQANMQ